MSKYFNEEVGKITIKELEDEGVRFPVDVSSYTNLTEEILDAIENDDNKERSEKNISVLFSNPTFYKYFKEQLFDALLQGEKAELLGTKIKGLDETIVAVYDPITTQDGKRLRMIYTGSYDVSSRLVDLTTEDSGEVEEVEITLEGLDEKITDYGDAVEFKGVTYKRVRINGKQHRVVHNLSTIRNNVIQPLILKDIGQVSQMTSVGSGVFIVIDINGMKHEIYEGEPLGY